MSTLGPTTPFPSNPSADPPSVPALPPFPSSPSPTARCWICWDDISASSPHAHPKSKRRRSIIRTSADPASPAALLHLTRRILSAGPWGSLVMAVRVQMGGAERGVRGAGGLGGVGVDGAGPGPGGMGRMGRRGSGPIKGGKRDRIPYRCNRCLQNLTLTISTRPLNPFVVMYRESGLIIIFAYAVSLICAAMLSAACILSAGVHVWNVAMAEGGWGAEWARQLGLEGAIGRLDGGLGNRGGEGIHMLDGSGYYARGVSRIHVQDAVERMGWGTVTAGLVMSSLGWWLLIKFILHPFHGRVTRHVRGLVKQLSDTGTSADGVGVGVGLGAPARRVRTDSGGGGAATDTENEGEREEEEEGVSSGAPGRAAMDQSWDTALPGGVMGTNVIRPLVPGDVAWERRGRSGWLAWVSGGGVGKDVAGPSTPASSGLLPAIHEVDEDDEDEDVTGFGVSGLVDLMWELAGVGAWRGGDGWDGEDD
ncbi:hypothetical protein HDU93_001580 [Gonapodya sp. JEL0774]|nr:hypothetical protein HDU93_001580 [Gonapodya sp. JEL0774]